MIGVLKGTFKSLMTDDNGEMLISFKVADRSIAQAVASELRLLPEKKKTLRIQVDRYRKDRTAEQNRLLWALMEIIANALHCSKITAYETMLENYGLVEYLGVKDEAVESLKRVYRVVKVIKPCQINGSRGMVVKCVVGSHLYNTKEMTTLIDGVFEAIKDMEIATAEVMGYSREWEEMRG